MNNYSDIKVIVFDFDGTLVDTMGGFADIAADVIQKNYGWDFNEARKSYLKTSGIPFFQQLEELFKNDKRNSQSAKEFEERKIEGFFKERFTDDVTYTINELRKRGYKVVVSSNNFQYLVDEFVQRDRVNFDFVLGFKDGFSKGKDHFDFILKNNKIEPKNLLFVGDSIKDGEKAKSSKVNFIGKIGTFKNDDFVKNFNGIKTISLISELLEIL